MAQSKLYIQKSKLVKASGLPSQVARSIFWWLNIRSDKRIDRPAQDILYSIYNGGVLRIEAIRKNKKLEKKPKKISLINRVLDCIEKEPAKCLLFIENSKDLAKKIREYEIKTNPKFFVFPDRITKRTEA